MSINKDRSVLLKPEFIEELKCKCGSTETVGLILHEDMPYCSYICWCACGKVTVLVDKEVKEVFDFHKD